MAKSMAKAHTTRPRLASAVLAAAAIAFAALAAFALPACSARDAQWTDVGRAAGISSATRVVCLGDSFLLGYAREGTQTNWGQVIEGLTGCSAYILAEADTGFARPGNVGDTFTGCAKFAHKRQRTADVVIIGGGINDCLGGYTPEELEPAAYELGRALIKGWRRAEVYVFCPLWPSTAERIVFGEGDAARVAAIRAGLERAFAERGREGQLHIITDCQTWLLDTGDASLTSADGVHPLSAGQEIIGERMLAAIAEIRAAA